MDTRILVKLLFSRNRKVQLLGWAIASFFCVVGVLPTIFNKDLSPTDRLIIIAQMAGAAVGAVVTTSIDAKLLLKDNEDGNPNTVEEPAQAGD